MTRWGHTPLHAAPVTARTPGQKANACTTLAEVEGFIAHAQEQLRNPHTDHAYWEAIRLAGIGRRAELQKRLRK